jgi:uncharacterized RDD family membrane protein YckC
MGLTEEGDFPMSDIQVHMPNGAKPYGGFWRRVVAAIIDSVILLIPMWLIASMAGLSILSLLSMDAEMMAEDPDAMMALFSESFLVWGAASTFVYMLYKVGFEGIGSRATPGKMAMSLQVTDREGESLSIGATILRTWPWWAPSAFLALDGLLGTMGMMSNGIGLAAFVSCLVVAFTVQKQGVHDMMAGALVVKKGARFEAAGMGVPA